MRIIDDEDDALNEDNKGDEFNAEVTTLYLSLIALEDNIGFQALKVNRKVDKQPLFFMVNSGSTHSFLDTHMANLLQCDLKFIKPFIVDTFNGDIMICSCTTICKDFKWRMQAVDFKANVFVVDLNSCDMVFRV